MKKLSYLILLGIFAGLLSWVLNVALTSGAMLRQLSLTALISLSVFEELIKYFTAWAGIKISQRNISSLLIYTIFGVFELIVAVVIGYEFLLRLIPLSMHILTGLILFWALNRRMPGLGLLYNLILHTSWNLLAFYMAFII